jgi:opacity protein-like surface antigen
MNKLAIGLAVSLAALSASAAVKAADPIVDTTAIAMATSGWDGPYAGIGVIFETAAAGPAETVLGLQGVLGANATMDSFLVGGEVYIMPFWSSINGLGASIGAEARAGFLASEAVLLYGALGGEIDNGGNTFGTVGGGVEFMVSDGMSLDLEYKYYIGLNNAGRYHHVGASANWHF